MVERRVLDSGRSKHARAKVAFVLPACFTVAMLVASCSDAGRVPIVLGNDLDQAPNPPVFVDTPDAGPDVSVANELTAYCPSTECPVGYTTCPDSRFPCDVNLKTDPFNCGACGASCPRSGDVELFTCVDGRCEMTCRKDRPALDCDGVPDNGCETSALSNENCGACGSKCPDPAKPCVDRGISQFGCGCTDGKLYCPETADPHCTDATRDDKNCAACGNACDPAGDGSEPPPNMYFGCLDSECGKYKCRQNFDDCDLNIENGCESFMVTAENCGACGNACAPGQQCALDIFGFAFCACPNGLTFCPFFCMGDLCIGKCSDLAADPLSCGMCGAACPSNGSRRGAICKFGSCDTTCESGWADCNENGSDGCEVNIASDPGNCGACGVACDAVAGQACVGGRCVVEPCDERQDDAGVPR